MVVSRESIDRLKKTEWWFTYHDGTHSLTLNYYRVYTRPSTRHSWIIKTSYNRIDPRECFNMVDGRKESVDISVLAMSDEFKTQVRSEFSLTLKVNAVP